MATVRLLELDDVRAVTRLLIENRSFLAPWEPTRPDDYFTEPTQLVLAERLLGRYAEGTAVPLVVLDPDGRVGGRVNLTAIEHGAFASARLGYWVAQSLNGLGLGTRAVGEALDLAFGDLGLHRVEAGTLVHNRASQRVLARNGFQPIGLAPDYLRIDGRWQDHLLFQALSPGPT